MAIGDALSKSTTYGDIEDILRVALNLPDEPPSSYILKKISLGIQTISKKLNGQEDPAYLTTNATLTISGSANPYTVDLSGVAPFIDRIVLVVHVTTGGTRTEVQLLSARDAENIIGLTNYYGSSIFGLFEGDVLRLYKGSSFSITTASDTIELKYYRQPKVGSVSTNSVLSDTAFTIGADGITITNFTGMTTAYVGGTFIGSDNAGNPFARTIVHYVSATSFVVGATIAGVGAATNGYVVPPGVSAYTVTRGTYLDLPEGYVDELIELVKPQIQGAQNGTR